MSDKEPERPSGRCWPWSHDWSPWRSWEYTSLDVSQCLRCGRRRRRCT